MQLARANHCRLGESFNIFFARTHELLQYHFRTVALAFEYDKACLPSGSGMDPRNLGSVLHNPVDLSQKPCNGHKGLYTPRVWVPSEITAPFGTTTTLSRI
jgi:hypothetical protein